APVAEQPVGAGAGGGGRERPPLHRVDVEPAVAVVVQQADAAAHGLGELAQVALAVVERERQPARRGVVDVPRDGRGGRDGLAGGRRLQRRAEPIGDGGGGRRFGGVGARGELPR